MELLRGEAPVHDEDGRGPVDRSPSALSARWIAVVLALAAVNHLTGRLGLLLAIPPGFATAVFPPSGIALAAVLLEGRRLAPGVFLGSFSFNIHLALASSAEASVLGSAPVAASIAAGSTLQALAGHWAVCRFTSSPTRLVLERDVILFLVLGGPLSCLVAATWGVGTLWAAGLTSGGAVGYTWFTWWAGDTIGVLIFTPLVLALLGAPRSVWRPRLRSVGVPLGIAFGLVVAVFVIVSASEEESVAWSFRREVETLDRALRREFVAHSEVLWSIRSFFAGSQEVDREEFRTFVRRPLSAHSGLRALSFNQYVRDRERAAFEADLGAELGVDLVIRGNGAAGDAEPAEPREEYVVVRFIEPLAENEPALGYDVRATESRRIALERARDTGEPAATEPIQLVQDPDAGAGFLLFMPIYTTDATPPTEAERRDLLRGFAVAVYDAGRLFANALEVATIPAAVVSLWDESGTGGDRLLARSSAGAGPEAPSDRAAACAVTTVHGVGGRRWTLRAHPTEAYLASQTGWQAWLVLAAGLTFTGLLGALLLCMTGRAALEAARLNEVAEVNGRLKLTNEELARFAYAASHDLRAPLRNIDQLVSFTFEDHGEELPDGARGFLERIQKRARHLSQLLEDLLEFSRVGWIQQEPELVDTDALLRDVVELSNAGDRFTVAAVDLPTIETFRVPLEQVLRNLVSNAIKYHDRPSGQIEVSCRDLGDSFEFAVRDDGPGIPPKHHEQVFELFRRLTSQEKVEGSGMGLALVRKIVTNRGGRVAIESDGKRGTTVRFTWPKARPVARRVG